MQGLGRFLFRWRSFTPVPLLALAAPVLWLGRGPAAPAWLVAGLALCVAGQALRAWVLGQVPDGTSGQNEKLIAVALNVSGPYAHTRNPLYLGNLLITLGLCAVAHSWALLAAVAALFALQYRAIIAAEEDFLRSRFGAEFDAYCARVPRFWPRVRAADPARRPYDWRRALRKEHNPCAAWIAIALALLLRDHLHQPRPYLVALALTAAVWLAVKAWKHRWLSGNFLNDFRRRLRETAR